MVKEITTKVGLGLTGVMLSAGTVLAANPDAQEGINAAQGNLETTSLTDSIAGITNLMITIIGIVSVIMLIIGGFRYVLSGGDQKGTTAAKDTILYAIIGVVVALLSYSIMNFVINQL
jgi:hypothetical protein